MIWKVIKGFMTFILLKCIIIHDDASGQDKQ